MPSFAYAILRIRNGELRNEKQLTPHHFAGTAEDFAYTTLRAFIDQAQPPANELLDILVWDCDLPGVGVHGRRAARLNSNTLALKDPTDRLQVADYTYYVLSGGYDVTTDDVLGGTGSEATHGNPNGLLVPGSGPAVKARTGHQFGYVALEVQVLSSPPRPSTGAADLWEAVEQVTIQPSSEVQIYSHDLQPQEQFPDLAGARRTPFLTLRVSVHGRDANPDRRGNSPFAAPLEWHRIEAWPTETPGGRIVLRRDATSRSWERNA